MEVEEKYRRLPEIISLEKCYPDPFNNRVNIVLKSDFPVPVDGTVSIFNSLGEEVRVISKGLIGSGKTVLRWDGKDGEGRVVPSGLYLVQLRSNNFRTGKPILFIQ